MREILFRGKRIDNGEWIYWNRFGRLTDINGEPIRVEINTSALRPYAFYVNELPLIDEETVGQYTGLTDKNGKKIFEGDIMRYGYPLPDDYDLTSDDYLAIFADGAFCGQFIDSPKYTPKIYDICFSSYYIVGNKWDNSELLEVMR